MSMSTNVVAFRDMDGEFSRMLDIKQFCDQKKVSYPQEVKDYFKDVDLEDYTPDGDLDDGDLHDAMLKVDISAALQEWSDDSSEGYEVDVAKLPSDVKTIRFYNSW